MISIYKFEIVIFLSKNGTDEAMCIVKFEHNLQAWQHDAKILVIIAEDDKQILPKWHTFFYENCPERLKENIMMYRYPGAGHMIEPPFTPHARAAAPGRKRMSTLNFMPEKFYGKS